MTDTPAATMTTDTAVADRVVPTPDLQTLIHRLNSTVYGDGNDELVETLAKCLKGKASNAKAKTTISTLVSILNDCVDKITEQREKNVTRKVYWTRESYCLFGSGSIETILLSIRIGKTSPVSTRPGKKLVDSTINTPNQQNSLSK